MKIIADTSKCVGAGQLVEKAREAAHVCPSQALSLEE